MLKHFFGLIYRDNDLDGEGSSGQNTGNAAVAQSISEAHQALLSFWPRATEEIKNMGQVRVSAV